MVRVRELRGPEEVLAEFSSVLRSTSEGARAAKTSHRTFWLSSYQTGDIKIKCK